MLHHLFLPSEHPRQVFEAVAAGISFEAPDIGVG